MTQGFDERFGQIAVRKGFATQEQVDECLELHHQEESQEGEAPPLHDIMVERGYLSHTQVLNILDTQRRVAGPPTLGSYEIISQIGDGGMGKVLRARVMSTGNEVALKILRREFTREKKYVDRFSREAAIGLELSHPNIVETLQVGRDHGIHFLAMELMNHGNLATFLESHGKIPERSAVRITMEIAKALQYANERDIVHRDVKPENIMFGPEGEPKLADFGLVKRTDPEVTSITQVELIPGSLHYVSPEQARNEPDVDIRSDIYSLGGVFYHMTTGRRPFEGDEPLEILQKHMTENLTPPDELNPDLSDACVAVMERMMAKDPDHRYETPAQLIEDLKMLRRGEDPVKAALMEFQTTSIRISPRRGRMDPQQRRSARGVKGEAQGGSGVRDAIKAIRPRKGTGIRDAIEVLEDVEKDERQARRVKRPRRGSGERETLAEPGKRRAGSKRDLIDAESRGIPTAALVAIGIGVGVALLILMFWERMTGAEPDVKSDPPAVAPNK